MNQCERRKREASTQPSPFNAQLCYRKLKNVYLLRLQNPKKGNPPQANVGLSTKADFGEKQKLFDGKPGGYAWIPAEVRSNCKCSKTSLIIVLDNLDRKPQYWVLSMSGGVKDK